jgi:hypothetical protein
MKYPRRIFLIGLKQVMAFNFRPATRKTILSHILICLGIATLFNLFYGCGESPIRAPRLDVSEESWDFGTVKIGSDVKHTVIVKNTGSAELTLYAYPSCPACMFLELEKFSIPAKSETKLHVKVVETEAGPYEGFIMVDSSDPTQQVKKLTVKGTFINQ